MFKKAILPTVFLASLSLLGLNYYHLSQIESFAKESIENMNGEVNWSQKLVLLNRLDTEFTHGENTFILKATPSYLFSKVKFNLEKAKHSQSSSLFPGQDLDMGFQKIHGYYSTNQKPHFIHIKNPLLSVNGTEIIAKDIEFSFIDAQNPYLLSFSGHDARYADLLSIQEITYNTLDSAKNTKIEATLDHLSILDAEALQKNCHDFFDPLSSDLELNVDAIDAICHPDYFESILPMSTNLYLDISNNILQGKPEDGEGLLHIMWTTPAFDVDSEINIQQTPKTISANLRAESFITDQDRYAIVAKANGIKKTNLEKDYLSGSVSTDAVTFNPIQANLKRFSTFTDDIYKSSLDLSFDNLKSHYLKIDGVFVDLPEGLNPEDLSLVGRCDIGHPEIQDRIENYLKSIDGNTKTTINNPSVEIYAATGNA